MANDENSWQVIAIDTKTDKSPSQVADVIEKLYGLKVRRIPAEIGKRIYEERIQKELVQKLNDVGIPENYSESGKKLFILGSGDLHHATHGLVGLSGKKGEFGVAYWDAHTDDFLARQPSRRSSPSEINCGNFARLLVEECGAEAIAYVGVMHGPSVRPAVAATQQELKKRDIKEVTEELIRHLPKNVYDTVDLDVLVSHENVRVKSDWASDGLMGLDELCDSISVVRQNKNIFAADIVGYESWEAHRGWPASDEWECLVEVKSCLAVSAVAGEIMGLDTLRAREIARKVDYKIEHLKYLHRRPLGGPLAEMLEKKSEGAPRSYQELLKVLSEKA